MATFNLVADEVQETLDWLTDQAAAAERLAEVVRLLSVKEPAICPEVESSFRSCTLWEGDYYCQDDNWKWHLVDVNSMTALP